MGRGRGKVAYVHVNNFYSFILGIRLDIVDMGESCA